jgi:BMFP domain-containing protein YqiC
MNGNNPIDDLVNKLLASLPQGMADLREDAQRNFRAVLAAGLQRLDLVTREEFDAQRAVLEKARRPAGSTQVSFAQALSSRALLRMVG